MVHLDTKDCGATQALLERLGIPDQRVILGKQESLPLLVHLDQLERQEPRAALEQQVI